MLSVPGTAPSLLTKMPPVAVEAPSVLTCVCIGVPAVPIPVEADNPRVGVVTSTSPPLSPARIEPPVLVSVVVPVDERPAANVKLAPTEIVVVVPVFDDCVTPSTAPIVNALLSV